MTALVLTLALAAGMARAATVLDIRGGGDGHGIGLSQYGAYGYALHGADYRTILAHYYQGTQIGTTNPRQVVRVLLKTGDASFAGATRAGRIRLNPSLTYVVSPAAGGALRIKPVGAGRHGRARTVAAPLKVTGRAPVTVVGMGAYRGALELSPDGSGGVQTVDAVGLDDYVRGVVAAEMPAGWAPAALQAQAVAARTYAITTTVDGSGYNLYDDTRSQMYGGVGAETAATDAAVAATRGQVVTYDGQPVVTYFFASSGGYTESIQNVWPGSAPEPWLQAEPDPYDDAGGNPYHSWASHLTMGSATRRLHGLVRGRLIGIRVVSHGVSPRIIEAQVVGTRGTTNVSGSALAARFGLPATLVTFTTITTHVAGRRLSGSVFPSPGPGGAPAAAAVQYRSGGGWRTVAQAPLTARGSFTAPLPGPGRYRVLDGAFAGPAVTAP